MYLYMCVCVHVCVNHYVYPSFWKFRQPVISIGSFFCGIGISARKARIAKVCELTQHALKEQHTLEEEYRKDR